MLYRLSYSWKVVVGLICLIHAVGSEANESPWRLNTLFSGVTKLFADRIHKIAIYCILMHISRAHSRASNPCPVDKTPVRAHRPDNQHYWVCITSTRRWNRKQQQQWETGTRSNWSIICGKKIDWNKSRVTAKHVSLFSLLFFVMQSLM